MPGHLGEAELLEQRLQHAGRRRGELDEFKAAQAHRVVKKVGHQGCLSWVWGGNLDTLDGKKKPAHHFCKINCK